MNRHRSRPTRGGFTLIEMLMVIVIIGLLASLTTVAVYRAIRTARERAVTVEIGQLSGAMQAFKEQKQIYPPCMGAASLSATNNRASSFTTAMNICFPRNGNRAYATYSTLSGPMQFSVGQYTNYRGNQMLLDSLDPSEAMVFWLGGMPTPVPTGANAAAYGSRKLYGFHQDPQIPFRLEAVTATTSMRMGFRTPSLFDFNEARLLDQDQDGWWEYVPNLPVGPSGYVAPYVYYDAGVYTPMVTRASTISYQPYPTGGANTAGAPTSPYVSWATLQNAYGVAAPYARVRLPTSDTNPIYWSNPSTFQIISGGLDSLFGAPGDLTARLPAVPTKEWPTPEVGSGAKFANISGVFSIEEQDNLTNFTEGEVGSPP